MPATGLGLVRASNPPERGDSGRHGGGSRKNGTLGFLRACWMKLTVSCGATPWLLDPLFRHALALWWCIRASRPPPHHRHPWSPICLCLAQSGWRSVRLLDPRPFHVISFRSDDPMPNAGCGTLHCFKAKNTRLCFAAGGSDESAAAHLTPGATWNP